MVLSHFRLGAAMHLTRVVSFSGCHLKMPAYPEDLCEPVRLRLWFLMRNAHQDYLCDWYAIAWYTRLCGCKSEGS